MAALGLEDFLKDGQTPAAKAAAAKVVGWKAWAAAVRSGGGFLRLMWLVVCLAGYHLR